MEVAPNKRSKKSRSINNGKLLPWLPDDVIAQLKKGKIIVAWKAVFSARKKKLILFYILVAERHSFWINFIRFE